MKIKYIDRKFKQDTLAIISTANVIIEDYQARGYELTLRQLYYQLVARDLFPEDRRWRWTGSRWVKDPDGTKNAEPNYKWLGDNIAKARDAGLVDWEAIVDRTRNRDGLTTWTDPGHIIRAAYQSFRTDKWKSQDYQIFVWVEKEALAGVIQRACENEDIQVDYLSCRGYMSASTIWREAQTIAALSGKGKTPIIVHLGDHDPSGIDMTRDNLERLELYSGLIEGQDFEFKRIALNYDQVEEYDPPPNPAKLTDSRANGYIAEFGGESWELDALDPDVLVGLIQDEINLYKDEEKWGEALEEEKSYKNKLRHIYRNWEKI